MELHFSKPSVDGAHMDVSFLKDLESNFCEK